MKIILRITGRGTKKFLMWLAQKLEGGKGHARRR